MRRLLTLSMLLAAGCANAPRGGAEALCSGSAAARDRHAQALLQRGEGEVLLSGQHLVALIDAACAKGR